MPAHGREVEQTFEISGEGAAALCGLLDDLCARGVAGEGRSFRCEGVRRRVRSYLYLPPPAVLPAGTTEWTERLIFEARDGDFRGRLSSKCWKVVPGGLGKHHCGEVKKAALEEWAALLRDRPVVEAALVKAQRRYTFRAAEGGGFRIALDAMVPFPPDDPHSPGAPFYHLEVEAEGDEDLTPVVAVLRPLHRDLAEARGIWDSKKEEAARRCGGAGHLHVQTTDALRRYLADIQRAAAGRLGALLPRLMEQDRRSRSE